MLCVIWLDRKYCRWNCTAATLEPIRWIHLHRECLRTSFICYFIVTVKKLIWPVVFLTFLFMVTSRGTIFICSAGFIEHFSVTFGKPTSITAFCTLWKLSHLCVVQYCIVAIWWPRFICLKQKLIDWFTGFFWAYVNWQALVL